MARYELTKAEWQRISGLLPPHETGKRGRPPENRRLMLNAMMRLAKSEAMWEDLPERYGSWKTVYTSFCKWRDEGVLNRIFEGLSLDADYENLSLDSSSITVHQHASSAVKKWLNKQSE